MTDQEREGQQRRMEYLHEAALRDRETAQSLRDLKRYDWSLFIYHLAIEKVLKALVIKAEQTPPPIHQLNRLAELAELEVADTYQSWLVEITQYNIEARYDDEKMSFYRKASAAYTEQWHERCNEIFLWLESKL